MLEAHEFERSITKSQAIDINPAVFYQLVDIINDAHGGPFAKDVEGVIGDITLLTDVLEDETQRLSQSFESILSEMRHSTRRKNPFNELLTESDPLDDLQMSAGNSFVRVVLEVIGNMRNGFRHLLETSINLRPEKVELLSRERFPRTFEEAQMFSLQYQMYSPIVMKFTNWVLIANLCQRNVIEVSSRITGILDQYYKMINHRHSVEGIKIHLDPITTDVALSIYQNIDAHGEIQDGKNPDELSAYTMRKAILLAESIQTGLLGDFTQNPDKFIKFITEGLGTLWGASVTLNNLVAHVASDIKRVIKLDRKEPRVSRSQFDQALRFINDLNPQSVTYKDKTGLMTMEERHELEFQNKTIEMVAMLLREHSSVESLIKYVLGRKQELREYNLEENSFYICKIGSGNPFMGEAPGELQVIPGIKPTVDLSEVVGSGFKEVLDFMHHTLDGAKWFDVFLATSPSKKADKGNGLLIGPQGCHRKGQKILMFDGSLKSVEKIKVGDMLMGPDSTSRMVLELHRGSEEMVEIVPTKGDPWVVNKSHILTLVRTQKSIGAWKGRKKQYSKIHEVKDVSVRDYLGWSSTQKHVHALFRVGVEFGSDAKLPLDSYFMGILLGDGCVCNRVGITNVDEEVVREVYYQAGKFGLHVSVEAEGTTSVTYHISGVKGKTNPITKVLRGLRLSNCDSSTKFIPKVYKVASRENRLSLLAGLVDTDGHFHSNCIDYSSKSRLLANDIAFVARSLGLAAYVTPSRKKCQTGIWGDYFRVSISGDLSVVPTRLKRKKATTRRQVKTVLHTGMKTRELPEERYYGFTINGDHRYLLGDFTVTHNCGKTEVLRGIASDRRSIGIFAQASDFLTCWRGEAEKNPKRLFEAGLKIQRESKKQVFFLIDEIDTILNGDRGSAAFGGTNLATEFQVLMDGITSYPSLALWGATNHPERISMPLIRRFSKVVIVGELSLEDRIKLLKQFLAYLPCSETMNDEVFTEAATRLDGAVGDVMRKVVDHVWREKMSHFVNTQPEAAEIILELLNQGGQKFHPSKFTQTKRNEMHKVMRPFVEVEPQDLMASVDLHLSNISIQNEIQTAKLVYDNARQFIAQVNS